MRHHTRNAAALVAVAVCFLAACSDDGTGPGGNGDGNGYARAVITDDPDVTSQHTTAPTLSFSRAGVAAFTGEFSGTAQIAISADGSTWIDLGSPAQVTVDAQSAGDETVVHGEATVPAGTYTMIRVTFEGVNIQLDAGSTIGGLTLTAGASVVVGGADGEVVIEKQVSGFTVSADASTRTEVVFDLNSEAWVTESAVTGGVVSDAEVRSQTSAWTRAGTR
jgi:hypothetical protein